MRNFRWIVTRYVSLGLLLVGLAALIPIESAVMIGADEGFELAKATLLHKGFESYADFWNDQTPLHTSLIARSWEHFGRSIFLARMVTFGFALLLLGSFLLILEGSAGILASLIGSVLLLASPGFVELSSSCMLEVPALSTAVAALAFLIFFRERTLLSAGISGSLFAIALSTKLITVTLLPMAGLILVLDNLRANSGTTSNDWQKALKRAGLQFALFLSSTGVSFLVINWLVDGGAFLRHFHQSWASHFALAKSFEYGSASDHPFDAAILLKNWDLTIPALIGIVVAVRNLRKNLFLMVPVAWLALMLAIFSIHRPWWSYYYVHIAIPLCWCAAIGIVSVWSWVRQKRSVAAYGVFGTVAVCILAWNVTRVYLQISDIRNSPQTYSSLVLQEIERFKPFTKFIYADEPIYSFHAGIPMPPQLAVVPLKRLWSGNMTNARIAAEMRATKPELVMLKNDGTERPFSDLILHEYQMVYEDEAHRLYAHRSIVKLARY